MCHLCLENMVLLAFGTYYITISVWNVYYYLFLEYNVQFVFGKYGAICVWNIFSFCVCVLEYIVLFVLGIFGAICAWNIFVLFVFRTYGAICVRNICIPGI